MQEDPREIARRLIELAGLRATEERIASVAGSLPLIRATGQVLSAVDYHDAEPACRFHPPRPQRR
jgi:Asp-tRNA(Asn)/Glu-tRNA(Gln) amidotransferase C subunit